MAPSLGKARRSEWEMAPYPELVETIYALFSVLHLHILIGRDVGCRRFVLRIDMAGSRGSHTARLCRRRREFVDNLGAVHKLEIISILGVFDVANDGQDKRVGS